MSPKLKKYSLLVIAIFLLIGLSFVTYSQLIKTKVESQQGLIQEDVDKDAETLASFSKSTIFLIVCIVMVAILIVRRKTSSKIN